MEGWTGLDERHGVGVTSPRGEASEWGGEVVGLGERGEEAGEGLAAAGVARTRGRVLARDAVVVGEAQAWGGGLIHHCAVGAAGRVLWPIHFGTLGYSVPGAIGVRAALSGRRVVAACGDGGFMFCANELATAVQHRLDLVVVLVNNDCLETIRRLQERRYGTGHAFAAELKNPDFTAYAQSFGCFARRVEKPEEFEPALRDALDARRPAVVEITFPVPPPPGDYGLGGSISPPRTHATEPVWE